jgi:hypothetical protein
MITVAAVAAWLSLVRNSVGILFLSLTGAAWGLAWLGFMRRFRDSYSFTPSRRDTIHAALGSAVFAGFGALVVWPVVVLICAASILIVDAIKAGLDF